MPSPRPAPLVFLLVVLSLLLTAAPSPAPAAGSPAFPRYKEGELIVRYKDASRAKKKIAKGTLLRFFRRFPIAHVRLPAGMPVRQGIREYLKDPDVLYAEPNYLVRKSATPNDSMYPQQWNLPLIFAPAAWERFTGSDAAGSVLVAVLDTGIAYTHPDLVQNLWTNPGEIPGNGIDDDGDGIVDDYYGANFGGLTPGDPWDDDTADSHGSHVSGIIGAAGDNGPGIAGINWGVRIMAVKFLHGPEGYGELSDALSAMEYALARGAKIINCSFEVAEDPSLTDGIRSVEEAVAAADAAGALVVSAAGNGGLNLDRTRVYPASVRIPNNISVAAVTRNDTLAGYSDYGRHVVDIAAPGGTGTGSADAILSTVWLSNGSQLYRTTAGTSMAAPHVSGAAALIWNSNPALTGYQVKARILNGADAGGDYAQKVITGGRLNLERALTVGELPAVFDVSPYRVQAGTEVTVTGTGFGAAAGSLTIGGSPATLVSWSDGAITARVPAASGDNTVRVSGGGGGFPLLYPAPPSLQITANPVAMAGPGTVVFNLGIAGADTRIVKYEWSLGGAPLAEIPGVTTSVSQEIGTQGEYLVGARVTDDLGRTAEASLAYRGEGSSGSGGCFIATAAYGSYLHPKVGVLRRFRDRVLMGSSPGRLFVDWYYRHSPALAAIIARHDCLRVLARLLLTPVVFALEAPFPTLSLLGFSLFSAAAAIRSRKRLHPC